MSDPIWPVSTDLVEEVLHTWQNAERTGPDSDAADLIQAFADHGLQILPLVEDDTPYVVVDGEDVTVPHPPNDAAGIWLAKTSGHAGEASPSGVVLRPATDEEIAADEEYGRELNRRDRQL